jgi:hypothetical protein
MGPSPRVANSPVWHARKDAEDRKAILTVWHELGHYEIVKHSATLAGLVGVSTVMGLDEVLEQILRVLKF